MYSFLNKLIFKKSKSFIALKTLGKPKKFNKTPLGKTGCLANPYFLLTGCLAIQFFDLPPYLNTVSWATFGYLPLTVQHLCDLQDNIPCHWSPSASHPTPCYSGKQRISLG